MGIPAGARDGFGDHPAQTVVLDRLYEGAAGAPPTPPPNQSGSVGVTPPCEPNASTPSPRVLIFDEGTLTARTVGWKQRSSQSGHSRNAMGKNPCVRNVRGKARGRV